MIFTIFFGSLLGASRFLRPKLISVIVNALYPLSDNEASDFLSGITLIAVLITTATICFDRVLDATASQSFEFSHESASLLAMSIIIGEILRTLFESFKNKEDRKG